MAKDVDHAAMDDAIEIILIAFDTGGKMLETVKGGCFLQDAAQYVEVIGIEFTALGRVMQLLDQRDMMKERRISRIA